MSRDYVTLLLKGAVACIVLAVLGLLASAIIGKDTMMIGPVIVGNLVPVLSILFLALSGLFVLIAWLISLYEIATAKNDSQWKALWLIVLVLLGIIGWVAYLAIARKERKA